MHLYANKDFTLAVTVTVQVYFVKRCSVKYKQSSNESLIYWLLKPPNLQSRVHASVHRSRKPNTITEVVPQAYS